MTWYDPFKTITAHGAGAGMSTTVRLPGQRAVSSIAAAPGRTSVSPFVKHETGLPLPESAAFSIDIVTIAATATVASSTDVPVDWLAYA